MPVAVINGQATASPLAIEATGLVKSFGDTKAVDGVDLAVRSGSVYGVLGPNGAGKTTTIRMLATLLRPTRARRESSGTMSSPRATLSAARSASPASSRRWTRTSPAART